MDSSAKKKFWTTSKAALWGGALVGGLYLLSILEDYVFGPRSHEGANAAGFFFCLLPELVKELFGIGRGLSSALSVIIFEASVNMLFGALVFFICAAFWQFILKGKE